jgi:hypothetical protein
MKNKDIAEVFRRAAESLDFDPEEECVYLNHEAIVLIPHDPVVGTITFELHPRTTPVWKEWRERMEQ